MSLSLFAPFVARQVQEIIKHSRIGICPGPIKILNPMPSNWMPDRVHCDRFKIVIPYGGTTLEWDIIFQANSSHLPPDFMFEPINFVELEDVKALMDWDPKRPDDLYKVLQELLLHYQKYQVGRLEDHSRVQFEYSTLTQQTSIEEKYIEVHVSDEKDGPINFLIDLGVNFNGIAPIFRSEVASSDIALLLVTFNGFEGTKITHKLCIPPKIEHCLGIPMSWRIPAFSSDGCLMDYVPFVQESLKKRIELVVANYEKRMEYLTTFMDYFEGCCVEFDRDLASKVTFLFEHSGFCFIFHIDLPQSFPLGKPTFTFRSVYHSTFDKPFSTTIINYPYNQGWKIMTMLEKTVDFVKEYTDVFKRNSVQNGLIP